ncbi:MAG: PLP-dependent aminotransferase family protein [Opitutaceae bacterium]|nr:PLP-dependent aminotransferase family protein [Opitutaceae bacterium]
MPKSPPFSYQKLFSRAAAEPFPAGMPPRGKYDFAVAYPDPVSLPYQGLVSALLTALAEEGRDLAIYGDIQGYRPLREYVAAKLARDRRIKVGADDIILGDGSAQPLHMVFETLVDPGDVVLAEDFVYIGTLRQLRRFRANLQPVPCDGEGMQPGPLEAVIRRAIAEGKPPKLIYTVPTYQNPQGWTMSLPRRKALVALAQKYDIPILEDDCYWDLRYEGGDVPSLYTLDGTGRVIYFSSFSKIIAPGMRMGYMTAPPQLLERCRGAKSGGSVNTFAAFAIHRYAKSGQLDPHIREINAIQRYKRDTMLQALERHFGGQATWSRPQGGLFIWVKLPPTADVAGIRDQVLADVDVGYLPGPAFATDGVSGKNYLRLCFGYNTPEEIGEGVARLAVAFRQHGVPGFGRKPARKRPTAKAAV